MSLSPAAASAIVAIAATTFKISLNATGEILHIAGILYQYGATISKQRPIQRLQGKATKVDFKGKH